MDNIIKHAGKVVELRRTLSNTERELAEMVARYEATGGSRMEFDTAAYGALNTRLIDAARKRMKEEA